jgi:hypothetical protein
VQPDRSDLREQLALLTDNEAELCLNGLLKNLSIIDPPYEQLLGSSEDMEALIQAASEHRGVPLDRLDKSGPTRAKAIRRILVETTRDPDLAARLNAWLNTARPTLLEPVTSALVLAGVVLLLSTSISVEYSRDSSKSKLRIKVEKPGAPTKVIEKIAELLK